MCALIYQTVWLREFRLIFGASTAASAAVLAIFMGGLGAGSFVLGVRADAKQSPLRFYAVLEALVAISAALSPFLLWIVRAAYLGLGGATTLGTGPAVILRLALSALVLGIPTFLMGGTLPAAVRASEIETDRARHILAIVYGANTFGAVLGVVFSTFYLLEHLGNHATLWTACALNVLIALVAFGISRFMPVNRSASGEVDKAAPEEIATQTPLGVVLGAAAAIGFVFLLMELVWYRMLAPLLGGSTFTFGIILAIALLGIGLGSGAYALFGGDRRPTLCGFALTCAAEAFCIALPFALGDRIAVLTLLLRSLGAFGFQGHIFAWTLVTGLVVFPAAFISGIQFPLLIALLGKGRERVGTHTGFAYAANTVGAIAGSLAGGFGLLPALSATGAWQLVVIVLAFVGAAVWIVAYKIEERVVVRLVAPALITVLALLMLHATGPTPAWRQSPIGAGRGGHANVRSRNAVERWLRLHRRRVVFQTDGIESCLGVTIESGIAFVINGKVDGNAVGDAGTQIMGGLIGTIVQPSASRALVVGLGTGSTAGWLTDVPAMERVDVVELEKSVLKVAEACAPVNRNVLSNPKVHITIGDAREALLTSREGYDVIASEPSNPYRAGVASLFTKEFYEASKRRLRPGGVFLQWVQAYEVDAATIKTIYATFASVFPVVETWQSQRTDLIIVGRSEPAVYDVEALRKRIAQEPIRTALATAWRVTDVEGVLAHYVANDVFAKEIAAQGQTHLNTDDRNLIEFAFARTVGMQTSFSVPDLLEAAHSRGCDRPSQINGQIDWERVQDQNTNIYTMWMSQPPVPFFFSPAQNRRVSSKTSYVAGDFTRALDSWRSQPRDAENLTECAMMAELLALKADAGARKYIEKVREYHPDEALMLLAELQWRQGHLEEAAASLESAFISCRKDPWPMMPVFVHALILTERIALEDKSRKLADRLYRALEEPFAVFFLEERREETLLRIALLLDEKGFSGYTLKALMLLEPHFPWGGDRLLLRENCYRALNHPLAGLARRELDSFMKYEPKVFDQAAKIDGATAP